ncbi:MAG: DUF192 domain-containing protein [Deltaproteobacteria bacterium]|nr:DUF192 domain-containing protein [Deltaproteobacteria bacterium]
MRALKTFLPILVALAAAACSHQSRGDAASAGSPAVYLLGGAQPVKVRVELARTPEERAIGLMHRQSLPADAGMLFLFDKEEPQAFWMKNTHIPLDMLFIDQQLKVVGLIESAEPRSTASRKVDAPARYVLEVNAGFAAAHHIGVGTKVRFEGVTVP